jgi:hypothetical protein
MAVRRPASTEDSEFRELRRRFVQEASVRAAELRTALDRAGESLPAGEAGLLFRKVAHDLRAAGGAYGFPIVSLYAGEVEDTYLDRAKMEALLALVRMLEESLQQAASLVA